MGEVCFIFLQKSGRVQAFFSSILLYERETIRNEVVIDRKLMSG